MHDMFALKPAGCDYFDLYWGKFKKRITAKQLKESLYVEKAFWGTRVSKDENVDLKLDLEEQMIWVDGARASKAHPSINPKCKLVVVSHVPAGSSGNVQPVLATQMSGASHSSRTGTEPSASMPSNSSCSALQMLASLASDVDQSVGQKRARSESLSYTQLLEIANGVRPLLAQDTIVQSSGHGAAGGRILTQMEDHNSQDMSMSTGDSQMLETGDSQQNPERLPPGISTLAIEAGGGQVQPAQATGANPASKLLENAPAASAGPGQVEQPSSAPAALAGPGQLEQPSSAPAALAGSEQLEQPSSAPAALAGPGQLEQPSNAAGSAITSEIQSGCAGSNSAYEEETQGPEDAEINDKSSLYRDGQGWGSSMSGTDQPGQGDTKPCAGKDLDANHDEQDDHEGSPILSSRDNSIAVPAMLNASDGAENDERREVIQDTMSQLEDEQQQGWEALNLKELAISIEPKVVGKVREQVNDSQDSYKIPKCLDLTVRMELKENGDLVYKDAEHPGQERLVGKTDITREFPGLSGTVYCGPLSRRWYHEDSRKPQGELSHAVCHKILAELAIKTIKASPALADENWVSPIQNQAAMHGLTALRVSQKGQRSEERMITDSEPEFLQKWDRYWQGECGGRFSQVVSSEIVRHVMSPAFDGGEHKGEYQQALQDMVEQEMRDMMQRLASRAERIHAEYRVPAPGA